MDTPIVIYLAGPMRGIEDYNYPAFDEAAARYRAEGYAVLSPAENFGRNQDLPVETYMRTDIGHIMVADVVVLLKGWAMSKGATLEQVVAEAVGLPTVDDIKGEEFRVGWSVLGTQPEMVEGCGG